MKTITVRELIAKLSVLDLNSDIGFFAENDPDTHIIMQVGEEDVLHQVDTIFRNDGCITIGLFQEPV